MNTWVDITTESYREYRFAGGEVVRIEEPSELKVSENGHRIKTKNGEANYYVPNGWVCLTFDGEYVF